MRVSRPRRATPQQIAARVKAARTLAANAPRDTKIMALRHSGFTLQAIADEMGLTRQRVSVILGRMRESAA